MTPTWTPFTFVWWKANTSAGPSGSLTEDIALNIGEGELLVGIEILDAKRVLGAGKLPSVVLENVPFRVA